MREFTSFAGFAQFLGTLALEQRAAETRALDRAAKLLQAKAKEKFGEYQPEAGPYSAWPQLAQSTQDQRVKAGFTANDPLLRRGDLRESIERQVEPGEAQVGSNEDVMVYQELGTARIPPRPVLGATAFENAEKVAKIVGDGVYLALAGQHEIAGSVADLSESG